ncbi:TIGR04222 domain-containing membrane protein [Amycolatopsis pittospori]|uniref:TIGR04222 domain-containing membrane protein n=1 Tax=Amycolatopsis pittospori TaxID=2749434 RepID=UPI0015EFF905|nr:TIGR04222 domain-containing membrane protein [Amycolatopsis pittospori]
MADPWGISGPDFAWLYAACAVVPFALAGLYALWLRRGFRDGGRLPSVQHVAALAGGADRVTDTVIAALLEREQVRIAGSGRLYRTPLEPVDPIGRELVRYLPREQGRHLRQVLGRGPAMRALHQDLARRGLFVREGRRRTGWLVALGAYVLLLVVGVLRLVNGLALDRPVGLLITLLFAVVAGTVVSALFGRKRYRGRTTAAGRRALAEARRDRSLVTGAAGVVALTGLAAYPDAGFATALSRNLVFPAAGMSACGIGTWGGGGHSCSGGSAGGGDGGGDSGGGGGSCGG